jgi:hypothetical protein
MIPFPSSILRRRTISIQSVPDNPAPKRMNLYGVRFQHDELVQKLEALKPRRRSKPLDIAYFLQGLKQPAFTGSLRKTSIELKRSESPHIRLERHSSNVLAFVQLEPGFSTERACHSESKSVVKHRFSPHAGFIPSRPRKRPASSQRRKVEPCPFFDLLPR